jgi:hypothetical protein
MRHALLTLHCATTAPAHSFRPNLATQKGAIRLPGRLKCITGSHMPYPPKPLLAGAQLTHKNFNFPPQRFLSRKYCTRPPGPECIQSLAQAPLEANRNQTATAPVCQGMLPQPTCQASPLMALLQPTRPIQLS